jgi:DNA-binding NtrC family response regulator
MKPRVILLFTVDGSVQECLEEAIDNSSALVLVAHNLRDALEIIVTKGHALDCAIVDIDQEFSGITLLGGIEACRDPVLVIVIATNPACAKLVTDRDKAMRFLNKPLPPEVLAQALTYPVERPLRPVAA